MVATIAFAACNKEKTLCLQSDVTVDYHTLNQYDSTYQIPKFCMEESNWENVTYEGLYNPNTGNVDALINNEGTTSVTYYNFLRGDSVTQTAVTYSVPE